MPLRFLIAVVLCEALAEIVSSSAIFEPLRARLRGPGEKPRWLGALASCGYCMSFWTAFPAAYVTGLKGDLPAIGWWEPAIWALCVHRAANIGHAALSRVRDILVRWGNPT